MLSVPGVQELFCVDSGYLDNARLKTNHQTSIPRCTAGRGGGAENLETFTGSCRGRIRCFGKLLCDPKNHRLIFAMFLFASGHWQP